MSPAAHGSYSTSVLHGLQLGPAEGILVQLGQARHLMPEQLPSSSVTTVLQGLMSVGLMAAISPYCCLRMHSGRKQVHPFCGFRCIDGNIKLLALLRSIVLCKMALLEPSRLVGQRLMFDFVQALTLPEQADKAETVGAARALTAGS